MTIIVQKHDGHLAMNTSFCQQVPLSLSFYTPVVFNWSTICDIVAGAVQVCKPCQLSGFGASQDRDS